MAVKAVRADPARGQVQVLDLAKRPGLLVGRGVEPQEVQCFVPGRRRRLAAGLALAVLRLAGRLVTRVTGVKRLEWTACR